MVSNHKWHDALAKIAAMDPESCGLIDAIHLAREALASDSATSDDAVGVVTTGFVSAHGDWRQELVLSKKEFLPSGTQVFAHPNPAVSQGTPVAFDVMCGSCGGSGLNRDDSNYGCGSCNSTGFIEKMLYTEVSPVAINDAEFKNFHRLLCERFEYGHDPVHWRRDQLSLIEWIARQCADSASGVPAERLADGRWKEYAKDDDGKLVHGFSVYEAEYPEEGVHTLVETSPAPAVAQEPVALNREYIKTLINALEDNSDPVSIDAAEEFRRILTSAPAVVQEPVAQSRGYALLGTGNYLLNHSDDFHPELGAELIITLATEKDNEGNRQVGETRHNPDHLQPIQPEDMVVRIGFLNERGLFALENQLSEIRKQFFDTHPAPSVEVNEMLLEAVEGVFDIIRDSEGVAGYHMNGAVAVWDSFREILELEAALAAAKELKAQQTPAVAVNEQLLEQLQRMIDFVTTGLEVKEDHPYIEMACAAIKSAKEHGL